jgi:hypothetical protein
MPRGFDHRMLYGWISEFANRALPGVWPQIPLDDGILADFDSYFDLCEEAGYNEVAIWGLCVDRQWPLDIRSAVDADRRARIVRLVDAAHRRGVKVYAGIGVYSWGFDAIVRAHPHLSRTNVHAMCPSVPDSHAWMERVVDFVVGSFDFDGLNMQSADQGRCTCPDCAGLGDMEYHARLYARVARYIHGRWPGRTLVMDNWGLDLSDPSDLSDLVAVSGLLGYAIDTGDSAGRAGRPYRRKLAAELACPFGTLAGLSVWPPQRWPREKWFLPTTLTNVDYLRGLYEDGGRAAEQFVTTLANPSGEVSLRFMGRLLCDVSADPEALLREAVAATYDPSGEAVLDGLVGVVRLAEAAYFDCSGREPGADLFFIDGGLTPAQDPSPETYLRDMSRAGRAEYGAAIARAAGEFDKLRPDIRRTAKADLTARCFETVLADVARLDPHP